MLRSAVTDQYEKIGSTAEVEQRVFAKIAWRFVPILTLGFLLNHLDRNNIGFAALQMNQQIGLTATQFGIGAGILFLGYCFFELPSNLLLYRVGARVWLSRIMITWGLASAAMIFVTGPKSWYVLRFALGAAEAGFFPGVAFYLSSWFPKEYRTRILAWFLVAIPASSVFGGPLSGIFLGMDGVGGLAGWKWLFLLEGLPTILLGIIFPWVLTNRPVEARWLAAEEQRVVVERIQSEKRDREMRHLLPALRDARVLLLSGISFWIHRGVLRTGHSAASDREGAADIGSDRRIYYGRLLRRRVYRYGCVGCIRRPERKQNSKSPMDLPRFGGGSGVCDLLSELLALAGMDNCGSRRHQRGAVRFLGDSNAVSHRYRRRRRPCFHQRGRDGRRFFGTFYYGMAEGSYRIIQCGSRGHGGFPDTGNGVDWCAEVVCPRRVKPGKVYKSTKRIPKSTKTRFLVLFCDLSCASTGSVCFVSLRL